MIRCILSCKTVGLFSFAFCLGTIAGLMFPIWLVAVLEAILILTMGYCCLFRW